MGSGKTTVGRALAKRLNRRFVDSDHEIEARTGVSIPTIFEIEGEASFRQREAEVIKELCQQQDIVLATGGGAILNPQNRAHLQANGTVIYLHATINSILQRTRHDKNRPLLRTADPRKKLEELEAQRDPLYREIADLIIETGRPNVQYLIGGILDKLTLLKMNPLPTSARLAMTAHTVIENSEYKSLQVDLDQRAYPIHIGAGILGNEELLAASIKAKKVAIVTNTVVAPLYLENLQQKLTSLGKQVISIVLPDGEEHKHWDSLNQIFTQLLEQQADRKTCLLALGGGVVGDMCGFAASAYMRGIPFVQIPTTLLAQVDSSVGGKTGINHPLGKNMIGAFYQPQAVLADLSSLSTLPERELSAGLAEVIKHGAIIDAVFFEWIENNIAALRARQAEALSYAVLRSCQIKAEVVRQDEREGGLRAILNFGHTFGHAIEAGMGYGNWLHGEAVGCGMVMAAELSYRLGYLDFVSKTRIKNLVAAAGLPVVAPDLGWQRWLDLMAVDKKNEAGEIKFILLKPLAKAIITTVEAQVLRDTINHCIQGS